MRSISTCPVCGGNHFSEYLDCKDYTVSHETFSLIKCDCCGFIITSPQPDAYTLDKYYRSDEYISHATRATSLFEKVYSFSRSFNLRWKIALLKKYCPADKPSVLDFGCGTGHFLLKCKEGGYTITGVEPSDIAREHANAITGNTVYATLGETSKSFDIITMWHVLEHIPDLNEQFEQLKKKMTKNGIMFIAVPNHESDDAKRYRNYWAGYDVPRHLWHFSHESMRRFIDKHDLTLEKVIPMKLDSFYVCILSQKYLRGKNSLTGMISGLRDGLRSNIKAGKTNAYSSLIYVVTHHES